MALLLTAWLMMTAQAPAATVADVAWLAGEWVGEGLGGQIDEVWSRPAGGSMVGYFRLVQGGKPVLYELMTLLEHEGSVQLRLKHANPDMTGWEEKNAYVTFRLEKQDATGAYFSGLTYRRTGPDSMEVLLTQRRGDNVTEQKLTYRRRK